MSADWGDWGDWDDWGDWGDWAYWADCPVELSTRFLLPLLPLYLDIA